MGDNRAANVSTAPRTRGGGPTTVMEIKAKCRCSPHPRGWSPLPGRGQDDELLLPAPAGMVPKIASRPRSSSAAPRTREDGPCPTTNRARTGSCSPHPRGWSLRNPRGVQDRLLLPAPAGMVPAADQPPHAASAAPRTRGDGPGKVVIHNGEPVCSPHPRGWSLGHERFALGIFLLPAPAGMVPRRPLHHAGRIPAPRTRGDGPTWTWGGPRRFACSPHPRGSSQQALHVTMTQPLLPAPAGMVPPPRRTRAHSLPLPAPAGMVPHARPAGSAGVAAPRTRGDGPKAQQAADAVCPCSPHPRGWSQAAAGAAGARYLLPAPAGMVPGRRGGGRGPVPAPRTRGDGPARRSAGGSSTACSPHPRGWSPHGSPGSGPARTAPRTRGDGPPKEALRKGSMACSPHPRGWSRGGDHALGHADLLPAPAGMVPTAGQLA
ncbi:putative secreted protein [Streptomyces rapamycinicus NRRL 5491]|uniref:Putative secreted protein n=1 Tax=Streptomyces rapamycinicus (strain ATCC 29253 / DSM 41530 / NRRL 5491 / AYB-994) TaxID=1343740 RepID=A0A3L8RFP5_STRRN|nr:putative secreted protein [Streptomyces rapamycinicus NRRL 5491]